MGGVRGSRTAGLRAGDAELARQGRRRHQVLPLPRPRTSALARVVDVGPEHRDGHRHPPEHRIPVPDGALLLDCPHGRRAGMGVAAAVAGVDLLRRRARCAVPPPDAEGARRGRARRRAGVHAHALHARLRVADLGDPAAVRRAAVAARAHHPCAARRPRVDVPGDLRVRGAGDRRGERDRADLRGRRSAPVDRVRGLGRARDLVPPRVRGRGQDRRVDARRVGLVDRGPVVTRRLRAQRPEIHRDPPDRLPGVAAGRGAARARLLVLLRARQARALDRVQLRLHGAAADHRPSASPSRCSRCARPRWCGGVTARTS